MSAGASEVNSAAPNDIEGSIFGKMKPEMRVALAYVAGADEALPLPTMKEATYLAKVAEAVSFTCTTT